MKIKSVSAFTCYVKSLSKTGKFYETLGFELRVKDQRHIVAYSNWFSIDFIAIAKEDRPQYRKQAEMANKGAGVFFYLSVENVDEFHKMLVSKRLKPLTLAEDSPWGSREFIIHDPDGYSLVLFKKK